MLDHLLAHLMYWQRPLLPVQVTSFAVSQPSGSWPNPLAPLEPYLEPFKQRSLASLPIVMADSARPLTPFGHQFQLSSVPLASGSGEAGASQLLASAGEHRFTSPLALGFVGLDTTASAITASAPLRISHGFMVNPTTIGLFVEDGLMVRGRQVSYQPQPGDTQEENWVKRNGKFLGYLVDDERSILRTVDKRLGEPLESDQASQPGNYRIVSDTDLRYADGVQPEAVFRKTKPMTMLYVGGGKKDWLFRHIVYLQVEQPLVEGERYRVEFAESFLPPVTFTYDPMVLRSEAVQVSHIGFAPQDPAKVAFLSTWLGDGGALAYDEELTFAVVDDLTHEVVFEGPVELSKRAGEPEDKRDRNYTSTNVYLMDFSALTTPGQYRVVVNGVGSSVPFEIQSSVWESAFYVSARGLLHQRSGIALGPPYTNYERPRPFHPDDGVKVYQSTVPIMDTNRGVKADIDVFEALQESRTDQLVPEAWGGWFDAGDWDRNIHHLMVSRLLLELALLHPDYFSQIDLNLPESENALPDIVDEALWGLDLFKRLQLPSGAVRGGIESAAHPNEFEASWQESLDIMVFGPGIWSSYYYAGVAAQAAYVLRNIDPERSASYQVSAQKAMTWAESAWQEGQGQDYQNVADQRNLAAAELYRLTGDERWHQLYLDTTAFTDPTVPLVRPKEYNQKEAAFVYAMTEQPDIDGTVQNHARRALLKEADRQQDAIANTGFKWNKHPYAPMGWGSALGGLKIIDLLRAHTLSGEDDYLKSAILASQFTLGANPDNTVFTTGLGYRYPQDPLIVDIRATGHEPPPGITIYGPLDIVWRKDYWFVEYYAKHLTYPEPWDWPTIETFFDAYLYIPVSEFTVMQTIAPTTYGLGYLAAVANSN